jgi:outer membrane immunogenic protein
MKYLFAGIIGLFALTSIDAASAADIAFKTPPALTAPSTYNWTGFYIGGNAGGAWSNFDPLSTTPFVGALIATNVPQFNAAGAAQSIRPNGFTGGFETGYNWQWSGVVAGIEADIEAMRLTGNSTVASCFGGVACVIPFTVSSSASTTWLATTRGRLGFAADNWLLYGTGGAAFTTLKASFAFSDTIGDTEAASLSDTKTGYAVGGGVEAGLWDRWTVKAEYLYVNFGRVSTVGIWTTGPQPVTNSIDLKANIMRGGLNYRF